MLLELPELRIQLDQMTERIVSRFKDRSRFPLNEVVYRVDGVQITGHSGISLLQFAIEGMENYHASLGRYEYPEQVPMLGSNLPGSSIRRVVEPDSRQPKHLNFTEDMLVFYQGLLVKHLKPEDDKPVDDPKTYGETVYEDADLLQLMHARVNIGRKVAERKTTDDPDIFKVADDRVAVLAKLRDERREAVLLEKASGLAMDYNLNPNIVDEAFRWMIERTIDVEIDWIQQVSRMNVGK